MPLLGAAQLRNPRAVQETYAIDERFQYLLSASVNGFVNIRHPGYGSDYDLLFSLHTPDHASAGIHYGFVLDACAIIADNRRDGWLSIDREGNNRVQGDLDHVLSSGDYWYNLPGNDPKWPIVTCFQDWKFPSSLPHLWQRVPQPGHPVERAAPSVFSIAVRARDVTCRISAHFTGTQVAHICPREELEWFRANGMARWNSDNSLRGQAVLDDHANLLLMRSDIHKAFDAGDFILYPKDASGFSLHMMYPSSDLGILYHNAKTHPIVKCRPEFLYARFARLLFRLIGGFLDLPADRAVIIVKSGLEPTRVCEMRSSLEIREQAASSTSCSPRKRKATAAAGGEVDSEGSHKHRRYSSETGLASATSLLETDAEIHRPSRNSAEQNPTPADDEIRKFKQLQDKHLQAQRPPGFVPFTGDPFEGTSDARTVLERLGFEIVDDGPWEDGVSSSYGSS